MAADTFLYLSRNDVESVNLPVKEIIGIVEQALHEKGCGNFEMPPKPGIHTQPDAFIHAMPAYIPAMNAAGMKWVSGYSRNPDKGIPYVNGLLILNDPENGLPKSVMDCTWITAWRTAAATAVAAKYLARKDSARVGIIACGIQGRSNLETLCAIFPVESVKAYDLRRETTELYATEMNNRLRIPVEAVSSVQEAVRGMDIVVTSGPILKNPAPALGSDLLEQGAFACALDFDSYWQGDALEQADKLATDDIPQLDYYRKIGYFQATPEMYADLGQIVCGKKPGRESAGERNICINLGLAIEDMAVAAKIHNMALEQGIGTELPL